MELKNKILVSLIALTSVFMIGRYTTPAKTVIKIEEKIVEKEIVKWKYKENSEENKNQETIIVETTYPDGTVKKETRILDKGTVKLSLESEQSKEKEKISILKKDELTLNENSNWNISLLASLENFSYNKESKDVFYGIHLQRKVLGPFSVGVFGTNSKSYGLSVGGSF